MVSTPYTVYNAQDRSYFAILKKEIRALAVAHGFSEVKVGQVDIVVAEMTSNLIKHGGGGELLVCIVNDGKKVALEMLCIDSGTGISDLKKMMEDGMSTANTMGHGLGSIKRLSDFFQVFSLKDWGTIVLARIYKSGGPDARNKKGVESRMFVVSKPGETVSGDGAAIKATSTGMQMFLGDGLGHGPDAHLAVTTAIKAFNECEEQDPADIIRFMHREVRKTRGLVGSISIYDTKEKSWRICGVGNICTRMYQSLAPKNYMSYNGTIGMTIPNTMKAQYVPSEHGQTLIMCSDGIRSRWDLNKYVGILKYDMSILAAAIYKDYSRHTDDTSVLLGRLNGVQ